MSPPAILADAVQPPVRGCAPRRNRVPLGGRRRPRSLPRPPGAARQQLSRKPASPRGRRGTGPERRAGAAAARHSVAALPSSTTSNPLNAPCRPGMSHPSMSRPWSLQRKVSMWPGRVGGAAISRRSRAKSTCWPKGSDWGLSDSSIQPCFKSGPKRPPQQAVGKLICHWQLAVAAAIAAPG